MSMKLLILGLLMEKDRHPYEMRQTMLERHWNETFRLRDGSLYYAVDQLREEGLIAAAEVIPDPLGKRPDKTVYRITELGREAFLGLLYDQLEQQSRTRHPLFLGLMFAHRAERGRLVEIIQEHLRNCEARIASFEGAIREKERHIPRGAIQMMRGVAAVSKAEREWLLELLAEAESGELLRLPGCGPEEGMGT